MVLEENMMCRRLWLVLMLFSIKKNCIHFKVYKVVPKVVCVITWNSAVKAFHNNALA